VTSPYFQRRTRRQEPCQLNLLIHTRRTLYACDIRFRSRIENSVTAEVLEKTRRLEDIRGLPVRPVLLYQGELAPGIRQADVVSDLISGDGLLARPRWCVPMAGRRPEVSLPHIPSPAPVNPCGVSTEPEECRHGIGVGTDRATPMRGWRDR
jgi:hypothetical protein